MGFTNNVVYYVVNGINVNAIATGILNTKTLFIVYLKFKLNWASIFFFSFSYFILFF